MLLSAACSPVAFATWSVPETFSEGTQASPTVTAVGSDGTVAVAWNRQLQGEGQHVQVAIRAPGGVYEVTTLSAGDVLGREPTVAVGPQGQVLVTWTRWPTWRTSAIATAYKAPGQPFQAPRDLDSTSRSQTFTGFDGAGNATIVWENEASLRSITRTASGTWSSPSTVVSSASLTWTARVAPNGDAVVVYGTDVALFAKVRSGAAGTFGAPQQLRQGRFLATKTAAAPDGAFVVASDDVGKVVVHDRPAGGVFAAGVAEPDLPGFWGAALAPGGRLTIDCVCVLERDGQRVAGLLTSDRPAGGRFGPPVVGIPESDRPGTAEMAYDRQGRLHAVWQGIDPITQTQAIVGATRIADGTWSHPVTISGTEGNPRGPSLAVAGDGVTASWHQNTPFEWRAAVSSWAPGADTAPPPPPPPAAQPPSTASTQTYQGGPSRTGRLEGVGLATPLTEAWHGDARLPSRTPVIGDGMVVSADRADPAGPTRIVARDLETGAGRWSSALLAGDQATNVELAFAHGRVAVSSYGTVTLLNAADGAVVWRRPTAQAYMGSPILLADRVIAAGDGLGATVYAFRLSDGAALWTQGNACCAPVTVAGDQLVSATSTGQASSINLSDGRLTASRDDGTFGGGSLSVGFDGGWLWAAGYLPNPFILSASSFAVVQRIAASGVAFAQPVAYLTEGERLVARHSRTLAVQWSWAAGAPLAFAPLVVDGLVLTGTTEGRIVALDRSTGNLVWEGRSAAPGGQDGVDIPLGFAAGEGHLAVISQGELKVWRSGRAPVATSPAPVPVPVPADTSPAPASAPDTPEPPRASTPPQAAIPAPALRNAGAARAGSAPRPAWRSLPGGVRVRHTGRATLRAGLLTTGWEAQCARVRAACRFTVQVRPLSTQARSYVVPAGRTGVLVPALNQGERAGYKRAAKLRLLLRAAGRTTLLDLTR